MRPAIPNDIHIHIRRQISEIYPDLKDVEITHAWGGYVGITMPRKPFVREVMPNVISAGGYSGHGVMLSNFMGKLYAETVAGNRDRLKLFEELKIPPFPGGRRFPRAAAVPGAQLVRAEGPDLKHGSSQPCELRIFVHFSSGGGAIYGPMNRRFVLSASLLIPVFGLSFLRPPGRRRMPNRI